MFGAGTPAARRAKEPWGCRRLAKQVNSVEAMTGRRKQEALQGAHLGQLALRHVEGLRLHIRQRRPVLRHLHPMQAGSHAAVNTCSRCAYCSFQLAPADGVC